MGEKVDEPIATKPPVPAGVTRALGFEDRRSSRDRRADETPSDDVAAPRRLRDRRESPGGHIRNVLQALAAIEALRTPDGDQIPVDGVRRALWLALMEVERQQARSA